VNLTTVQALRDEFAKIASSKGKLTASLYKHIQDKPKKVKEIAMKSLGRGGPLGGTGKAQVTGLPS